MSRSMFFLRFKKHKLAFKNANLSPTHNTFLISQGQSRVEVQIAVLDVFFTK